jgi:Helix-loop-helix DNA-binding domain
MVEWPGYDKNHEELSRIRPSEHCYPMPPPPPPHASSSPQQSLQQGFTQYSDVQFQYDSQLQGYYPPPPSQTAQSPQSSQLFSQSETTNIMGFLDNFNRDIDPLVSGDSDSLHSPLQRHLPPLQHQLGSDGTYPPLSTYPLPTISDKSPITTLNSPNGDVYYASGPQPSTSNSVNGGPDRSTRPRSERRHSSASASTNSPVNQTSKAPLSVPQKRMNHIMSEQKRRNAIRECYSTLIQLLAPENGGHTIEMPTRGRPKGSGAKSRGQTRGKSGILFRAVEFTKWLEEGNEALRREVEKMEAAGGVGS